MPAAQEFFFLVSRVLFPIELREITTVRAP